MILALALALAAPGQTITIDWPALAPLPYRAPPVVTPEMQSFVQREASERNCPLPASEGAEQSLTTEVAVLIDASGNVTRAIPRAIDCPTVEQYAAGLVGGFARANLLPRAAAGETWYKTSLVFSWKK